MSALGWGNTLGLTGLTASMAVHTMVTGLIVFKILKVFLEVNPVLAELTSSSTGGAKLRHVIFVIIESGMALFAIQLFRLVLSLLPLRVELTHASGCITDAVIAINQMLNVNYTICFHFYFDLLIVTFTRASHQP